jgi:sugar O-acyltransferase (sialic acid O-acetyltransferase NeuD family)
VLRRRRIAVIGAGGFAREVKWLISEIGAPFEFVGYVVSDLSQLGDHDSRDEVLGDNAWLEAHGHLVDCLAIGIGSPAVRLRVGGELLKLVPGIEWPALVHPTVRLDRSSCQLGPGVVLCAGVIGTVNVRLERFAMVNLSCTLGHEAVIGAGSVLNPTVNVSGGVYIGEGVLVGTGAQILQYVRIGAGATVGAGAVVLKDVPPNTTVAGNPARPLVKKQPGNKTAKNP